MFVKTLLLVALAAIACVGPAQAINCYECYYAEKNPEGVGFHVPYDENCGNPLGEGLTSKTFPDYSFEPIFPDRSYSAFSKLLGVTTSSAKAGSPYQVYCFMGEMKTMEASFGTIYYRGVASGDNIIKDDCNREPGVTACTCSSNDCNGNDAWRK